ncbi:MAG: PASTA domain-containing protein [Atribacterota bacterium]|jgi:serine/threonine-protein kinase|nr:PASTA domain-containing protein [Atribacterota bacterium]MDY0382466.1 PASTA domain-containing protein [Atribacterota bacterium]
MAKTEVRLTDIFIRILSIIIFGIGAVLLGGYGAFLTYQTIFAVPVVKVPSVVDMELDAARQVLYKTGFKMLTIDDSIFQQGEQYIVIAQKPPAGTGLKKNRTVEVEIRTAGVYRQIPELVGKTIAEAEALLLEYGYQIGEIAYTLHQKLPEGRIIAQTPVAGENKTIDGKINILVSKGLY